jgi:fluoride exporter
VTVLLVGAAGMAGVLSRYGISSAFGGASLPWATVAINVVGSLLLGILVSSDGLSTDMRTILGVGFLGGFTTFSTFTVQVVLDMDAGEPGRALLYLVASLGLGLAAATCGYLIGRELL